MATREKEGVMTSRPEKGVLRCASLKGPWRREKRGKGKERAFLLIVKRTEKVFRSLFHEETPTVEDPARKEKKKETSRR